MQKKVINPEIIIRIKDLSKCFWYWDKYYLFYSTILGISKDELKRRYPSEIYKNKYLVTEKILSDLQKNGRDDLIKEIASQFYKMERPFDEEKNSLYHQALKELKEFKNALGKDFIKDEIEKKKFEENIEKKKTEDELGKQKIKKLEDIKTKFIDLSNDTIETNKQKRGYDLENLFYDLIQLESIYHTRPYKTIDEQIDGSIRFGSFDYLVEIKWTEKQMKKEDISIFDGKIGGKAKSTRGLLLSISGFDDSAISAAEKTEPRMIFIDSSEFFGVLSGMTTMNDLLLDKEDNLTRFGSVYKRKR